jgi:hypothetical protein
MHLSKARKGLVTPITLTFLLFSFTLLTVATYYFAMSSVNSKAARLNYAAVKQDMLMLENTINSVAWSPSSSVVQDFQQYGGEFVTEPEMRRITMNLTLGSTSDIIFNTSIGYVRYTLPSSDYNEANPFLVGGDEPIINRSFQSTAQMYISTNGDNQEIYLGYRPLAISFLDTSETGTVNVVRIFVINLNSSERLQFTGNFCLRIRCVNVTTDTRNYNLTGEISYAQIKVTAEGSEGTVFLPLSSVGGSTVVRVEMLVCNIMLEEVDT